MERAQKNPPANNSKGKQKMTALEEKTDYKRSKHPFDKRRVETTHVTPASGSERAKVRLPALIIGRSQSIPVKGGIPPLRVDNSSRLIH